MKCKECFQTILTLIVFPLLDQAFSMMTDFLVFDETVGKVLDFAKADGDTLVLVFPDHNTGGLKIGNYFHDYKGVTVEDLVDPFRSMTRTANGIQAVLPSNLTVEQLVGAIQSYWGISISILDAREIFAYMREHRKNLSYAMARIVTERYTHVSFATHGHTGETGE